MNTSSPLVRVLLVFVLGTLPACPGPTFIEQQYPGAPRPAESIAIFRVNGSDTPRVLAVDDEENTASHGLPSDGRLHLELLPGPHVVVAAKTIAALERSPGACGPESLAFEAEAGKVYRLRVVEPADDQPCTRTLGVFEVDRSSDNAIRDVTRPPPAP